MGKQKMRSLLFAAVLCLLCVHVSAEDEAYSAANYAANLDATEPAKQRSLPIKFHTLAGLHRIDLDDEAATDEEYRAFQLARYTGEANMIIKQHEMEFMRKRRRERELGETHGEVQQPEEPQQPVQQPVQYHYTPPQQQNRMSEIMGAHMEQEEEALLQVGEGDEESALPFDAVHVSKSGDIEDHDEHFVMNSNLRHKELKNAVLQSDERDTESEAQKLAKKMEFEQKKIDEYNRKQAAKDRKDMAGMRESEELGEAMHEHHLTFDDKGRVIPDF